jgi:hypothetical protein
MDTLSITYKPLLYPYLYAKNLSISGDLFTSSITDPRVLIETIKLFISDSHSNIPSIYVDSIIRYVSVY